MEWTVRVWETAPEKRWVVFLVAVGCGALGWAVLQSLLLAALGFSGIMGGTSEYWLPLRYRLDERGASVRCGFSVTSVEWEAVKRVAESDVGVRLSPLEKPTRLAQFRGVFLRYAGNRDQVLEYVKNLRGEGARLLEPGTDG
jgi:hypothetical protein